MLQEKPVEEGTLYLIKHLLDDHQLRELFLVDGTALAIRLKHRRSIDIDLFTVHPFDAIALAGHLEQRFHALRVQTLNNAAFCFISEIKVDLLTHAYPRQGPLEIIDGIRMASLEDIAAMKLHAIHQSGNRLKDFVDVSHLLEVIPL